MRIYIHYSIVAVQRQCSFVTRFSRCCCRVQFRQAVEQEFHSRVVSVSDVVSVGPEITAEKSSEYIWLQY